MPSSAYPAGIMGGLPTPVSVALGAATAHMGVTVASLANATLRRAAAPTSGSVGVGMSDEVHGRANVERMKAVKASLKSMYVDCAPVAGGFVSQVTFDDPAARCEEGACTEPAWCLRACSRGSNRRRH